MKRVLSNILCDLDPKVKGQTMYFLVNASLRKNFQLGRCIGGYWLHLLLPYQVKCQILYFLVNTLIPTCHDYMTYLSLLQGLSTLLQDRI